MSVYIDNGININPIWTNHIAVSFDGVNWTTISKTGITVHPVYVPNSGQLSKYPNISKVYLRSEGKLVYEFHVQDVANQAGWVGGTDAELRTAVDDITSWL